MGRRLPCAARTPGIRDRGTPLDLAVRLEADEVPFELVSGIDDAVDRVEGTLDVLANYTAFQQIRAALGRVS